MTKRAIRSSCRQTKRKHSPLLVLPTDGEATEILAQKLAASTSRVSEPIVNEITRILADKFHWIPQDVADARRRISGFTKLVSPEETLDVVKADPTDNRLLECAVAAGSQLATL